MRDCTFLCFEPLQFSMSHVITFVNLLHILRLDASGGEDLERVRLLSNQGADSLAQEEMSDID